MFTCKSHLSWLDIDPNTTNVSHCIYINFTTCKMAILIGSDSACCTPCTFLHTRGKLYQYTLSTPVYLMNPCNIWGQFCPTHIWRDKLVFRWSDCETLAHTELPFGVWHHCKGISGMYGTSKYLLHIELAV